MRMRRECAVGPFPGGTNVLYRSGHVGEDRQHAGLGVIDVVALEHTLARVVRLNVECDPRSWRSPACVGWWRSPWRFSSRRDDANDDARREWSREQQLAAYEVMGSSQGVHLVSPVMRAPLTAVVTIVALAVSCTGTSTDGVSPSSPSAGAVPPGSEAGPSAQPVTDYDSFTQGLALPGSRSVRGIERWASCSWCLHRPC